MISGVCRCSNDCEFYQSLQSRLELDEAFLLFSPPTLFSVTQKDAHRKYCCIWSVGAHLALQWCCLVFISSCCSMTVK